MVESLEGIIPIYETASRRIALFSDREMREQVVRFAVKRGSSILDLGCGPGTMSAIVSTAGGSPVLLDVSRRMLHSAPEFDKVQSTFESLPFRDEVFDGVVAGFSIRDSRDLQSALEQISRVIVRGGRFGFCDLGKPPSAVKALILAVYLRAAVPLVGLLTGGRSGLGFASLYQTYLLTLDNLKMVRLLRNYFREVALRASQLGGAIVVTCSERTDWEPRPAC